MPETRYDDLRALFLSCTLKRSPEPSNTEGLVVVSRRIPEKQGVLGELLEDPAALARVPLVLLALAGRSPTGGF